MISAITLTASVFISCTTQFTKSYPTEDAVSFIAQDASPHIDLDAVSSFLEKNTNISSLTEDMISRKWKDYKTRYNLNFMDNEDNARLNTYRENVEYIYHFNSENYSFQLGETPFTHWTHEEYLLWISESSVNIQAPDKEQKHSPNASVKAIADRDWRKDNKVTPVGNQQTCGCGYAFAAAGAVESLIAIKNNKLTELSKQDLLDCSTGYNNRGCAGGSVIGSLKYITDIGVYSELAYPYSAKQGTCKRPSLPVNKPVKISGHVALTPNSETALATTISTNQPVTVIMDVSPKTFQLYKSGIYFDTSCGTSPPTHAALAVGIGSTPALHYIIKNSWGTSWGESGFMLLAREKTNQCGVATQPIYPTL